MFLMPSGFLRGWNMRSSTSLTTCLLLLFRYMLQLLYFFSFFFTLFVMTPNVRNFNRGELLLISPLILHISLGRSMGYPFPPNTQVVSSFFPLSSLFAKFLFLFQSLTLLSSNCSPLSKSIRSWYGWSGILS